jgi:hypothetical protein
MKSRKLEVSMSHSYIKTLIILTLLLCGCMLVGSSSGLLFEQALYAGNNPAYVVQIMGTDLGNLAVIVPTLLILAYFLGKNSSRVFVLWFGTLLYVLYLVLYNLATLRFNHLFLLYAVQVGLTLYALFIAIAGLKAEDISGWYKEKPKIMPAVIYLTLLGIFFISAWLAAVVPASIAGKMPKSAADLGLITAVFHGLDLGVFFPSFLIAAWLLYRRQGFGFLLAPAMLMMTVIMSLCLVFLALMTGWKGMGLLVSDLVMFGSAAILSAGFLVQFMRQMK